MAPKSALGDIQRTLLGLGKQVQRLQSLQGKAPAQASANWDCPHCSQGLNNFAHRSTCFKCSRDRDTGELRQEGPARSAAQGMGPSARARSRQPRAPSAAQAPKSSDPDQGTPLEEDPVGIELAAARSYVEWVRKQKAPVRDKELPLAQKRLSEAEARDKQRKPPAERLQSALSRVDHRQRLADVAKETAATAKAAAAKAQEEAESAENLLKEAQQELQVAQAVHRAWGPAPRRSSSDSEDAVYAPQGSFAGTAGLTPQQLLTLQQISEGFAPGTPHSDLLQALLQGVQPPAHPKRDAGQAPCQGPAKKSKADASPGAKGARPRPGGQPGAQAQSRSRSREVSKEEAAASPPDDAMADQPDA